MSKYIIKMECEGQGRQWLNAITCKYYLFLYDKFIPDAKARTHIAEMYDNKIGDCIFMNAKLYSSRGNLEIEGWALVQQGPRTKHWPLIELKSKSEEVMQSTREYETVLIVNYNPGQGFGDYSPGGNINDHGWFSLCFTYRIRRRSIKQERVAYVANNNAKDNINNHYDYYKIPDMSIHETYIPVLEDRDNSSINHKTVVPFTEERYELLRKICDAGGALGNQLDELLSNDIELSGHLILLGGKDE